MLFPRKAVGRDLNGPNDHVWRTRKGAAELIPAVPQGLALSYRSEIDSPFGSANGSPPYGAASTESHIKRWATSPMLTSLLEHLAMSDQRSPTPRLPRRLTWVVVRYVPKALRCRPDGAQTSTSSYVSDPPVRWLFTFAHCTIQVCWRINQDRWKYTLFSLPTFCIGYAASSFPIRIPCPTNTMLEPSKP